MEATATEKTEMEHLRALHGEQDFELEIDTFQFMHRRAEYLELMEEAKIISLAQHRAFLVESFQIQESPNYAALPEVEKEGLRMQQFVIYRHLLNNING